MERKDALSPKDLELATQPTRRRLLEILDKQHTPLSEHSLVDDHGFTKRVLSYHLPRLEAAGLVRIEVSITKKGEQALSDIKGMEHDLGEVH